MAGAGWEDLFQGDVGGSDVGGSATSSELGLRGSDGLSGIRPRRLPGRPTKWSILQSLARGHRARTCRKNAHNLIPPQSELTAQGNKANGEESIHHGG
jgi:hypothetical protein